MTFSGFSVSIRRTTDLAGMVKRVVNWSVFLVFVGYAIWILLRLPGTLFVVGGNDTAREIIGILAYCLTPVCAVAMVAFRRRRLAASFLAAAAGLWAIGIWDEHLYLHVKFGEALNDQQVWANLLRTAGVLLLFSLYYAGTAMMRWPNLRDSGEKKPAASPESDL